MELLVEDSRRMRKVDAFACVDKAFGIVFQILSLAKVERFSISKMNAMKKGQLRRHVRTQVVAFIL